MKAKLFIFCWTLFGLMMISCQKNEFDLKNPDVDQFVDLLKSGDYFEKTGHELPDFTLKHINRLMYYLKDTTSISMFPTNPVSSKYTNPKILNECLLWTIDGIRLGTKYPSLEPCLVDLSTTGYSRLSGHELLEVSELYINWYDEYRKNPSESLKTKDLLENTTYKWN